MKNNKTFIKRWELGGLPYTDAELKNLHLSEKLARALTDESCEAERQTKPGGESAVRLTDGCEAEKRPGPGRESAAVWLTDDPGEAEKLTERGACVVYLLTGANRDRPCGGAEWCAEVWEQEDERAKKAPEMPGERDMPEEREMPGERDTPEERDTPGKREVPGERDMPGKSGPHPGTEGWKRRLMEAEREGLPGWLPEEFLWRVWLRRQSLPWHICETRRLALREMTEEDLDFLYEMQESGEAGRFLERLNGDREEERQKLEAYRRQMYGFYGFGIWMVIEKESGACVGRAGLQMRDGFEEPELGFAIAEKYRRRGYAEEACLAVLEYAEDELELSKVRAVVDEENINSRRLCEKLGFFVDKRSELDGRMCIFFSKRLRGAP